MSENHFTSLSVTHSGVGTTSGQIQPIVQNRSPLQKTRKLCAFDALTSNASLLGISSECFLSTHSESPFYKPFRTTIIDLLHLPSSLRPTGAQMSYPHQPWIDCIPMADFRIRVILAASHRPPMLDTIDLWHDVLSEGLTCNGDPEEFASWKMSDDFVNRWQMLLTMNLNALEAMCLASNPPLCTINFCDA